MSLDKLIPKLYNKLTNYIYFGLLGKIWLLGSIYTKNVVVECTKMNKASFQKKKVNPHVIAMTNNCLQENS